MQKRDERLLFVEAVLGGEIQHVDTAEFAIRRLAHRALDGGDAIGVGRLP